MNKNVQPLVYIIIVNWNRTDDTMECLESLKLLEYSNYKVIVIDNGSSESCGDTVKCNYPNIIVKELNRNLGFAGGCNVGITEAIKDNAEYVWLLNNDTIVDSKALISLVNTAEKSSTNGIVGSKIYEYANRAIINHAGGKIIARKGITKHIGSGEIDNGQYNTVSEVNYVTGCSLLACVKMIEEIGLMEERFFLYFEETDWCLRAQKIGWKVLYVPDSIVFHKESVSTGGKESPMITYYLSRNSLLFFKMYYTRWFIFVIYWWPRFFLIKYLFRLRFKNALYATYGLIDWIKNKYGKFSKI